MTDPGSPFQYFFDVGWKGFGFMLSIWFILQIVNTNHWEPFFWDESDRDG